MVDIFMLETTYIRSSICRLFTHLRIRVRSRVVSLIYGCHKRKTKRNVVSIAPFVG